MHKDILSPEEIEALLKDSSEDTKRMVYPYDFRAPELLSKDKIKVLQIIMEEFTKHLRTFVTSHLQISLDIELSSLRQGVFKEVQEKSSHTFMAIFGMPPLDGKSLLEVDIPFIIFVNKTMLGDKVSEFPPLRNLTPVEEETGRFITERVLISLQEAFSKLVKFSTEVISYEKNPQLVFIASPQEPVIIAEVTMRYGESSSYISFCFPYIVFDSLLPYLDFKKWFFITQRKKDENIDSLLKNNLQKVDVELICELGGTEMSIKEILQLEEGDYIRLDRSEEELLDLKVGSLSKFKVKPGLVNRKIALRIEAIENTQD